MCGVAEYSDYKFDAFKRRWILYHITIGTAKTKDFAFVGFDIKAEEFGFNFCIIDSKDLSLPCND